MRKLRTGWYWLIPPLIVSILIVWGHSRSAGMMDDSDTRVLLAKIREVGNPWAWFAGDWPLENHFYRPISTLFFELDNALYRDRAAGYGLTNALLVAAAVMLLYAWLRELLDSRPLASLSAALFGVWC
ncbi:MAG: hypothetical protein MH204_00890, partial [Fimbriimonadaceae bacterium]|nr:hypothetical protein [Fimbriimonadaceae bacterium]